MRHEMSLVLVGLLLVGLLLVGNSAVAQDYVGDMACGYCHVGKYVDYQKSGHPWKILRTAGKVPDELTWPMTPVPPLPMAFGAQLDWADVDYVIGNFFWKARFIDRDGFIWTGNSDDQTQWNLATQEFVPYHPGEVRPFNCGKCHTTGYDPEGNQHGRPGLIGTWAQDGVTCEACHGPGGGHVDNPKKNTVLGGKDCAECHFRDADFRMPWQNGFMRHHQQAEDLSHSPHASFKCETCHDPHRSVVYDDGGTITECIDCHKGNRKNGNYVVAGMEFLECVDCHMPYMGKSAVAFNEFSGDIRGHLFDIMTEPIAAVDNVTDDGFWNQAADGSAAITLDYACIGCHIEIWPLHDLDAALHNLAAFSKDIHVRHAATVPKKNK